MGMNLELINQKYISRVVPRRNILIYLFIGQINVDGKVTPQYSLPIETTAQVQVENPEALLHIQGINLTNISKRFYIQSNTLTGLNRNINTGGDYIIMDGSKYKIISVVERFNVGWVEVIGNESVL